MAIQYDKCPSCGATIVKGAMRCTSCGALLTSAEEQQQRIQRLKEAQKKAAPVGAIIKATFLILAAGVAWYFFYDQIVAFVRSVLSKF